MNDMTIGMVGLGKMGLNLSLNMNDHDIKVIGYDKYPDEAIVDDHPGIKIAKTLNELVKQLPTPRVVWVMVPAGTITDHVLGQLKDMLDENDIVIDGGNSRYTDSIRHGNMLEEAGIRFLDVGTSGGQSGARKGACYMIGGTKDAFKEIEMIFAKTSVKDGYAYMGENGTGHFVKMVHNAVEYGMMQAIGEGFDLLEASPYDLDYEQVSNVWANGSIISGLLMDMVNKAMKKDPKLKKILGRVDDSGEGRWAVEEAVLRKVSTPVIAQALFSRFKSKDDDKFSEKVVAAMRFEFGGHAVYDAS